MRIVFPDDLGGSPRCALQKRRWKVSPDLLTLNGLKHGIET